MNKQIDQCFHLISKRITKLNSIYNFRRFAGLVGGPKTFIRLLLPSILRVHIFKSELNYLLSILLLHIRSSSSELESFGQSFRFKFNSQQLQLESSGSF